MGRVLEVYAVDVDALGLDAHVSSHDAAADLIRSEGDFLCGMPVNALGVAEFVERMQIGAPGFVATSVYPDAESAEILAGYVRRGDLDRLLPALEALDDEDYPMDEVLDAVEDAIERGIDLGTALV